jgi:hypothetical protein
MISGGQWCSRKGLARADVETTLSPPEAVLPLTPGSVSTTSSDNVLGTCTKQTFRPMTVSARPCVPIQHTCAPFDPASAGTLHQGKLTAMSRILSPNLRMVVSTPSFIQIC